MLETLKAAADNPPPLLSHADTVRLIRQAQRGGEAGREAMDQLIRSNVRLVLKTAFAFRTRCTPTVTLDDIVSAALIGVWNAVRLFNPVRGNRFSTYAVWAMKRSIQRTLANESLEIRLPVNRQRRIGQIRRTAADFAAQHGRSPSEAELIALTGLSREQIVYAMKFPTVVTSIDDPIGERNQATVGDVLLAPKPDQPIQVDRQQLRDAIEGILAPRLARVVCLRYGLCPGQESELLERELASRLDVSKQRVQQLLAKALAELRASPDFARFRDMLAP